MYSIFILGAGFSKPAGFPLGNELFEKILEKAKESDIYQNILRHDIERYLRYYNKANKNPVKENDINFEKFINFIDIEHFLRLSGSDTWSHDGNRTQIAIRNFIAQILFEYEIKITDHASKFYDSFVNKLEPGDIIFTFNYDRILEHALMRNHKNFRLFPTRFSRVGQTQGIVDTTVQEETVVLKMHGSIDWFSREEYDISYNASCQAEYFSLPPHAVFGEPDPLYPQRLLDGPYFDNSPLNKVYRIRHLDEYFARTDFVSEAPLILSPSASKILYSNPIKEFWYGFHTFGGYEKKVALIGFSLPQHDEYLRQALFSLIEKFQNYDPQSPPFTKSRLKIVDLRQTPEQKEEYLRRFEFINWAKTDCYFNGFTHESLETVFGN